MAIGDGWGPIAFTPDGSRLNSKLKKMCAEAGRDFSKIDISVFSPVEGDPKRIR